MKELLKYLKKESNSKSYSRGLQYYHSGAVERVEQNGNTFIGIVEGSNTYEVEITIEEGNIESDCDCPYNLDGICKHIVAVGLAIAAGEHSKFSATTQIPKMQQTVFNSFKKTIEASKEVATSSVKNNPLLKDITFERVFNHATPEQKIWFLKQILSRDANLRTQFTDFVQPAVQKTPTTPPPKVETALPIVEKPLGIIEIIEHTKKEIKSREIIFSNAPNIKKVQLDRLFDTHQSQINSYLVKADFVRAMAVVMGLHEFFLTNPSYNKDAVFKDFLAEKLATVANAIKGQLAIVTQKIIDLMFEQIKLPQYSHINQAPHCLAIFTPFLITITPSTDLTRYLYQAVLAFNADLSIYPPHLLFHIAELTQSADLWYSNAKKIANTDPQIAQKLLIRYAKDNRKNDFFNLAQKLFDTDPRTHAEFLSQYVQLTDYPKLYKQIWFYLAEQAINRNDYTVFDKLMPILLDTELDDYLAQLSLKKPIQYTQLLLRLKRYDDILECAISQQKTPNFEQIISPILSIYPLDSFGMIRQNVYDLLDKDQSRGACKKICEWLKLMQQIKGFEKETKVFINYMYEIKIPTLKNEMVLARFFG